MSISEGELGVQTFTSALVFLSYDTLQMLPTNLSIFEVRVVTMGVYPEARTIVNVRLEYDILI